LRIELLFEELGVRQNVRFICLIQTLWRMSLALCEGKKDYSMEHKTSRSSGFASMDSHKQREIARKGGMAAHRKGTAHEFTSDEARNAGRKGGQQVSTNRDHMKEIGRLGGKRSAERRRSKPRGSSEAVHALRPQSDRAEIGSIASDTEAEREQGVNIPIPESEGSTEAAAHVRP
jgi:hypothetical protein